jgi:hypothetical protein
VVECGGLENRYVGNPGVGGSNPPLSAAPLAPRQHAAAFGFRFQHFSRSALKRFPNGAARADTAKLRVGTLAIRTGVTVPTPS